MRKKRRKEIDKGGKRETMRKKTDREKDNEGEAEKKKK